jgi:hypothetical protein
MVSMRDFLKSGGRWLGAGWYWPLILLALPACAFQTNGIQNPNAFEPGTAPLTGEVMCDIPKPLFDGVQDDCATAADVADGLPAGSAAINLNTGINKTFALDFSQGSLNKCSGNPTKTQFFGPFPAGLPVCLNCGQQIPTKYADPTAVCVAKCKELMSTGGFEPSEGIDSYCQTKAHISTNFASYMCFDHGCTNGGTPDPSFVDPRRAPEQVKWTDTIGTVATGNTLSRNVATTGTKVEDFNAGAASVQIITKGDAWVEFEANDNMLSQVIGVRESCDDPTACADTDPSLNDIGFSIILNNDQQMYVIENPGVQVFGPFTMYNAHDRFRVHVTDNSDGTATITYHQVMGGVEGPPLFTHTGTNPKYPLRIDASFREYNATLANVTLMRIQ